MRNNRKALAAQRQTMDRRLREAAYPKPYVPEGGWLRVVRTSLGISVRQMAKRLGVSPVAVVSVEKNEALGKAALSSVERSALAMDCELVYAVVPRVRNGGLEAVLDVRARALAGRLLKPALKFMRGSDPTAALTGRLAQEERLANELKAKMDPRIWDEDD